MSNIIEQDLFDIYSGQILSRITANKQKGEYSELTRKVVVPKSIYEGKLHLDEMPEEEIKVEPDEKRITRIGDIVIKLSTPYDSAMVTEAEEGCIVPSFCAIIRNIRGIEPGYLEAFLNSSYCKEQLKKEVMGSVMAILSVGKIKSLEIPIPEIAEQVRIATEYRKQIEKIDILKQIVNLEQKRLDIEIRGLVK